MRRLCRLRSQGCGPADLLRSLRPAAPRSGERGYRLQQRRREDVLRAQRNGSRLTGLLAGKPRVAQRNPRDRPCPLLDHGIEHSTQLATPQRRHRSRPTRHRPQRQPRQRLRPPQRTREPRLHLPDHGRQRDHPPSARPTGRHDGRADRIAPPSRGSLLRGRHG